MASVNSVGQYKKQVPMASSTHSNKVVLLNQNNMVVAEKAIVPKKADQNEDRV